MKMPKFTPEQLREKFSYDPETGVFRLRVCRVSARVGTEVGSHDAHGYAQVTIGSGNVLKAHRVAWAMHYGVWPDGEIDHINGVRDDNRISNLRCVETRINAQNKREAIKTSRTGYLGVSPHSNGYRAHITVDRKQKYLGYFKDPKLAHEAYLAAKRLLHEGCTI